MTYRISPTCCSTGQHLTVPVLGRGAHGHLDEVVQDELVERDHVPELAAQEEAQALGREVADAARFLGWTDLDVQQAGAAA